MRKNQARLAVSLNKTVEEIKKERRIVKAILIQGILPFLTVGRAALTLNFGETKSPLHGYRVPFVNYSLYEFSFVLIHLNPLFDCVATLLVVRQYWEALKLTFSALLKNDSNRVRPVLMKPQVNRNIDGVKVVGSPAWNKAGHLVNVQS